MSENKNSRRVFLKWLGATGGLISVHSTFGAAGQIKNTAKTLSKLSSINKSAILKKIGPIDYNITMSDDSNYLGDQPQLKAHPILWDKENFLKTNKIPEPEMTTPLVIIGGGMSGLASAYLLRKYKPIILEQANRLGGNAKGEVWNGLPYSVGAAYYMEQTPGTELYKLFEEVGAHAVCRIKNEEDPTLFDNQFFNNFWKGETNPEKKAQFLKLAGYFRDVFNETNNRIFPEIPLAISKFSEDLKMTGHLADLDKYNFKDFLEKKILDNEALHPQIETMLEHYFWSTFASPLKDVSAAQGLNAYASEFGKVYTAPGGNSAVAECFLKKILQTVPAQNMKTDSLVVDVLVKPDHTLVTYSDSAGVLHTIKAKVAVMACPKFIVKHILRDIEPERLSAIAKLKYRAYIVGNVLIDQKNPQSFYDLFLLDGGKDPEKSQVTDVISSNYAPKKHFNQSVLTLYRGYPYDAGRSNLYDPESFKSYKDEMEKQLSEQILPSLKFKKENVKSIRITRWGHPMPVPTPGLIADGTVELIRRPFKERVFFIEQDNWMLAAIETSVEEALYWSKEIKQMLG
ncbi:MAG: FAD-dependent oxidoreductase [Bacteriovorax sp.]|jgi:protoporphyrinogen oxidase